MENMNISSLGIGTLIASMTEYISEQKDYMTMDKLENACCYVSRFPVDYATMFYKKIMKIDGIRVKLIKIPAYKTWRKKTEGVDIS